MRRARGRRNFNNDFPDALIFEEPFNRPTLVLDFDLSSERANQLLENARKSGFQQEPAKIAQEGNITGVGGLEVNTIPVGAALEITSQDSAIIRTGTSPKLFVLTTEPWRIQVRELGYRVVVQEGQNQKVFFNLKPEKPVQQRVTPPVKAASEGMALIPGGWFEMGSNDGDSDEKPVHRVYVDSFYIDRTEVTVYQYREFCDSTGRSMREQPEWNKDNHPVVYVSWEDAAAYAKWKGKRLPTEAEWEYAARGGNLSKGYRYSGSNVVDSVAWYYKNSGDGTHPVGMKKANELGLYDMSGNVWEWCNDWWDENYYTRSPERNPKGPETGDRRLVRGGSWGSNLELILRVANRARYTPDDRVDVIGFRCAQDYP